MHVSWERHGEPTLADIRAYVDEVARDLDPDTRYVRELRAVLDAATDVADYLRRLDDHERVQAFRTDGSQASHGERGRSWVDEETWGRMDPFQRTLANLLTGETRMMWAGEGAADFAAYATVLGDRTQPLRLLCVPCSTGKEAFSWAIAGLLAGHTLQVTGVDRQEAYLQRARSGRLVTHHRDWEHPHASEFLVREQGYTRVADEVLARCAFEQGDVLVPSLPAPGFDVVSCRNLLGYFRGETLERAWRHVADRVGPGGYLVHDGFVATGEPMAPARAQLEACGFTPVLPDAHWYQAPADWGA